MPRRARVDAEVCGGTCRVARHRADKRPTPVPVELRSRARWVRYSPSKVPLTVSGKAASSTNPRTWSTWAAACGSSVGAGPGFVLNGDGIVCIDLDHCLDGAGKPTAAAAALLARLPRTYVERSPSGDGLHVWGRGSLPKGFRRTVDGVKVEAYGDGRYITVTARPFAQGPLADLSAVLAEL